MKCKVRSLKWKARSGSASDLYTSNLKLFDKDRLMSAKDDFLRHGDRGTGIYDQYGQYQRYRQMSLDDMLLENRIIFLIGEINYARATEVIMKMLYLDNLKKGREISLYINSPGRHGGRHAGDLRHDAVRRLADRDVLHRPGPVRRGRGPGGGHQGQPLRPAARQDHAAPAVGRRDRPGLRHQDPGRGDPQGQADDQPAFWPSTPASRWRRSWRRPSGTGT